MRQVEGDLQTRLTRLIAGWPAGKREAAGEVLAELVGTIRAGLAVTRLRAGSPGLASRDRPGPGSVRRLDQASDPAAAETAVTAERAGSIPVCRSLMAHTRAASDRSFAAPLRESRFPRM